MKKKHLVALVTVAYMCLTPNVIAFAKPAESAEGHMRPASIEMEWQRLNDTWQSLTNKQKEQLYKAREAADKADCKFIDKIVDCKLIDEEIGERMKDHIKARTTRIRQDGDLPMFYRGVQQKPQA